MIAVILILFTIKTKIISNANSAFLRFLIGALICVSLDLLVFALNSLSKKGSVDFNFVIMTARMYVISLAVVMYLILRYSRSTIFARVREFTISEKFQLAPLILLLIFSPFLEIVVIEENGGIKLLGILPHISVAVLFLYAFIAVFNLVKHYKEIDKAAAATDCVLLAIAIVSLVLQHFLRLGFFLSFATGLVAFIIYVRLENPDDYVDVPSGALNEYAFADWADRFFKRDTDQKMLVLSLPGEEYFRNRYTLEEYENMLNSVREGFLTIKNSYLFRLETGEFLCATRMSGDNDQLLEKLSLVTEKLYDRYTVLLPEQIRYGLISDFDKYQCFDDFRGDLAFFVESIGRKEPFVLHVMNEEFAAEQEAEKVLLEDIKRAIDEDKVEVYFQPIYSVKRERFTTAEALIRIRDAAGSFINPELLIPVSERHGLILELGRIVFTKTCEFVKKYDLPGMGFEYIEVNLSTVQCMYANLTNQIVSIMKEYDVSPTFINFEITETAAIKSERIFKKNMRNLIKIGCTFSLDDFGSGYANLDYVINMPFSIVKIDKLLIWDSFKKEKSRILLENSARMFKNMKLKLVAEGVETKEELDKLVTMGFEYMQGFYFSKPVAPEEFIEVVSKEYLL